MSAPAGGDRVNQILRDCPRCKVELVEDSRFCHACGVSIEAAVSGEFETYNVDRFFN